MQLWSLPTAATAATVNAAPADGASVVIGLIGSIGRRDFGSAALARINAVVAAASWSVYCLRGPQRPVLHASGSFGIADTTGQCFEAYAAGLYRQDATFDAAQERAEGDRTLMTHWHASEIGGAHGERIYRRHGMRERLSMIGRHAEHGLLAVNLYRHDHQRAFADAEIDLLQCAAPAVMACVRQHIELLELGVPVRAPVANAAPWLRERCPALTERELQVCDRLLLGMTFDGIAADMGLSVATVKTYRNRAFERLEIHFRNELFSLALQAAPRH